MNAAVLILLPSGLHTLIDAADLAWVARYNWNSHPAGPDGHRLNHYVVGWAERQSVGLHRFLLRAPKGFVTHHQNGDGLDNRRSVNLEIVTGVENRRLQQHQAAPLSLGILPPGVPITTLAEARIREFA